MRSSPASHNRANHGWVLMVVPGLGQIAVALMAVVGWVLFTGVRSGWFWVGAALWAVAVCLKLICAWMTNRPVIGFLSRRFSYPVLVVGAGLFTGIQSSLFEMGATLLGVLFWPLLGHGARRAIAVGIGAGSFEAFLLGIYALAAGLARGPDESGSRVGPGKIPAGRAATPLLWLVPPVERIIAIFCHAASRALILLGAVHGAGVLIVGGFLLFTLLDGVAGAAHVSGKIETVSVWWVELAMAPFALASIPILIWCYGKYAI